MSNVSLYTIKGELEVGNAKSDDNEIAAKIIKRDESTTYLIKINLEGVVYQPTNKLYLHNSAAASKRRGVEMFKFITVSEWAFNNYIDYLKTDNGRFLKEVQRNLC